MPYRLSDDLRARLADNLGRFERRVIEDGALRHAAVAIVVTSRRDGRASVLLTKRPSGLRRHSNQFALPGGRMDEGETPLQTALREMREEVGLELGPEAQIGVLDDYATRSGFRMTPIVFWAGEVGRLKRDPVEVARILRVPLGELDDPAIPHLRVGPDADRPVLSAYLPTIGGLLHAPTAAILYQFREVAVRGLDTRVAHFDQPAFAWK